VLGACAYAIGVLPLRFVTPLDLAIAEGLDRREPGASQGKAQP